MYVFRGVLVLDNGHTITRVYIRIFVYVCVGAHTYQQLEEESDDGVLHDIYVYPHQHFYILAYVSYTETCIPAA